MKKKASTYSPLQQFCANHIGKFYLALYVLFIAFLFQGTLDYRILGAIAFVGLIPGMLVMVFHRPWLKKPGAGIRTYHRMVAYLVTVLTAGAYLLLLLRADQFGPFTLLIAPFALLLIFNAVFVNLQRR